MQMIVRLLIRAVIFWPVSAVIFYQCYDHSPEHFTTTCATAMTALAVLAWLLLNPICKRIKHPLSQFAISLIVSTVFLGSYFAASIWWYGQFNQHYGPGPLDAINAPLIKDDIELMSLFIAAPFLGLVSALLIMLDLKVLALIEL